MGPRIQIAAAFLAALMAGCQGAELPEYLEAENPILVVKYHPNGMRAEECGSLSGQRHGVCMTWDTQGRLHSEGRYVEGLREGTHFTHTQDGDIYRDYKAGLLDGLCTLVTRQDVVVDTPYHQGVPHGRLEARGPNGMRVGEMYFDHGELHGYWVLYRCCGLPPLESYCDQGQPDADCSSSWLPMAKMAPRSVMRWCNDSADPISLIPAK